MVAKKSREDIMEDVVYTLSNTAISEFKGDDNCKMKSEAYNDCIDIIFGEYDKGYLKKSGLNRIVSKFQKNVCWGTNLGNTEQKIAHAYLDAIHMINGGFGTEYFGGSLVKADKWSDWRAPYQHINLKTILNIFLR